MYVEDDMLISLIFKKILMKNEDFLSNLVKKIELDILTTEESAIIGGTRDELLAGNNCMCNGNNCDCNTTGNNCKCNGNDCACQITHT